MTTTGFFILAILALGFLITFQIAKASEYVSILKGEKKAFEQNNRINAFLMVVFLVLGLIGVWYCNELYYKKTLLPYPSASELGANIDTMLWITLAITGVVFVVTQILLFWFAYKYQHNDKRKPYYYPHNNKLEIIWTTIPAIALCVLVGFGLFYWFKITGEAPKDSMVVEITGKQFEWIFRYPGRDNTFGKKYYKLIDPAKNQLGMLWTDTTLQGPSRPDHHDHSKMVATNTELKADPAGFDDLVIISQPLYIAKDQPVKLVINAQDVIHDVGLPHFRLKMDAVPGTPTTLWFTPKYTTEEMRQITGNSAFEYEIACDQMCGNGHYTMRGVIKVVTRDEFILWRAQQKPGYVNFKPAPAPAGGTVPAGGAQPADTVQAVSKVVKN